jgi:hypothetical protein
VLRAPAPRPFECVADRGGEVGFDQVSNELSQRARLKRLPSDYEWHLLA